MRIEEGQRPVVRRGDSFQMEVDGTPTVAHHGETVASVMLAGGKRVLRSTRNSGSPRGLFCGIGVCYDCLVVVDGRANVRACMTRATPGMKVRTQQGMGEGEEE